MAIRVWVGEDCEARAGAETVVGRRFVPTDFAVHPRPKLRLLDEIAAAAEGGQDILIATHDMEAIGLLLLACERRSMLDRVTLHNAHVTWDGQTAYECYIGLGADFR